MGKTGDLSKKIRDTKEIFHAKMGTIKDRKSMDLGVRSVTRSCLALCDPMNRSARSPCLSPTPGIHPNLSLSSW